ncbi:hypothetical protein OPV22_016484 [Ensete ventricosum]|uniref:Cyanobacterial aminoacyl-tRNA synthetase CAAD domain-containing protein n=1 Tax=Ensete ventricosum TaxID=4639 RepID=A0AAV8QL69_ENSVE|nr:hypothetical protein OPV22_016484 [Ensete ventricosum]
MSLNVNYSDARVQSAMCRIKGLLAIKECSKNCGLRCPQTAHPDLHDEILSVSAVAGGRRCLSVVVKAMGDSSDTSSDASSIVKDVQNAWSNSEDRIAFVGLGFAAIVAVWASSNLIAAVDKLPLAPNVFEFIGILFSWWFIYRYLLFKPDREELSKIIKNAISTVLGK